MVWIVKQFCQCPNCSMSNVNTVKFLIVAASPIEAAPQTLKKLQFFYKKLPTLKTSN